MLGKSYFTEAILEILLVLLGLFGSIAFLATIWYLIRWIIGKADRKPIFRKRFFISIIVFMVGVVGFGVLGSQQNDKEAARLGFVSTQEYLDAKKEDISDPAKWAELIAQREAEENQRIADQEAEAARVKQEAEDQAKAEAEAKAEQERKATEELAAKEKATKEWQEKAIKLAVAEPKVYEAMWSQSISFWVLMDDDGTDRRGFADYICILLNDAGKPEGEFVVVTIWDRVSTATDSPRKIGKSQCR